MANSVPIDTRDITVTPLFKHVSVEDIPASEREGRMVMKTIEAVEVRFAGSKLYSPVFPVDAMWKRQGHQIITYAERWADQYRAFLSGDEQRAAGTPLEMLRPYGITPAQLSLCRTLKVYSIESLHHLEGQELKNLQMNANPLKEMARSYMADRAGGANSAAQIDELRAEVERLKAAQTIPPQEPSPDEVAAVIQSADDEYAALSNDEIKDRIKEKIGHRPAGNPSRETLVQSLRELQGAA